MEKRMFARRRNFNIFRLRGFLKGINQIIEDPVTCHEEVATLYRCESEIKML